MYYDIVVGDSFEDFYVNWGRALGFSLYTLYMTDGLSGE